MPRPHQGEDVRPVDIEVGDDGDSPGIAQELTTDDIDDIAFDTYLSVAERRRQLMGLLEEIRARRSGDFMGDMEELASHVRDRIASLSNPQESQTVMESTGMDADSRSDDDDPAEHIDDEDES
jgi:hypothetical protein